ncbi:MAG: hypothetical protein ACT4QE_25640 [Anaerolineales bacterium]
MPRRYYFTLTLATLTGAFLRLWQLTEIPAGLHYDIAATALLGNGVAFGGERPVFITAFTGHEVLFYYWLAAWFNLIGSSVFSLRLAAAMAGVLTIPATFFVVRQVLRGEPGSLQIATLASVLVAVAFFHVTFSRFGFRVITQPLIQSLALGFLLRGLWKARLEDWRIGLVDLALGGVFTGLAAYTYLSARLFPFPLAVFWLALLTGSLRNTQHATRFILNFAFFILVAALTFAPLGFYFLQHPEDFFNRFSQVAPQPGDEALVWQGVQRAAEMLFINGEPYDRYNLPGLPLFATFPLGVFFVIGLLATFHSLLFKRGHSPLSLAVELLLLSWLPFMLLPTAIAVNEIFPSITRAFGLTPLVFVFPARGIVVAFRWLQRHAPGPLFASPYPLTVIALITLALGAFTTYRQYFVEWANLPTQRLNNDADLIGIAEYLNQQSFDSVTPYVSAIHYRHPTLAYLAREFDSVKWLTGGTSLVIPNEREALYLFAASTPLPDEWIAEWAGHLEYEHPAGEFRVYRFRAGETPPLPEFQSLNENFGNAFTLIGYRFEAETDTVFVDLRWRVENTVDVPDYLPYARLYDAEGREWAVANTFTNPSEQWVAGDVLLTRLTLSLPIGLPPGQYTVKTGLYSAEQNRNLPRLNAQGGFGGERAVVGTLTLAGRSSVTPEEFRAAYLITAPAQSTFGEALQLLGYQLHSTSARQNERFDLTLFWYAPAPVSTPVRIALGDVPVFDETLTVIGVQIQRVTVRMPAAAAGPVDVKLSVPGFGDAKVVRMDAVPVARTFTAPEAASNVDALFDDAIALSGYSLESDASTRLTLLWQMRAEALTTDYTVFVHVRDEAGQNVAQADAPPQQGAYSTSLWMTGEFIEDAYTFELAPGNYSLVVGLYDAETGERLPVNTGGDEVVLQKFTAP